MNEGTCEGRVKIKKTSWHFKLYVALFYKDPKNLCDYMWKVFFGIFLLSPPVILIFSIAFLLALIARMTQWFFGFQQERWVAFPFEGSVLSYKTGLYGGKETWKRNKIAPWEIVVPILFIFLVLSFPAVTLKILLLFLLPVLVGTIFAVSILYLLLDNKSIFRRYIRARKEKYCPLIELVDE